MLTQQQLMKWLNISQWTVKAYLKDPQFTERCVIDVAAPGSPRKAYRFRPDAVVDYLNSRKAAA
jgi:hypothetical protein